MSAGAVSLDGFTADTTAWLREEWGCEGSITGARAMKLVHELRATPDERFPGGKWATIQHRHHQCVASTELNALHAKLRAEWDEHAGGKLLSDGGWRHGCEQCAAHERTNPHAAHATDQEIADHEFALAWLASRANR